MTSRLFETLSLAANRTPADPPKVNHRIIHVRPNGHQNKDYYSGGYITFGRREKLHEWIEAAKKLRKTDVPPVRHKEVLAESAPTALEVPSDLKARLSEAMGLSQMPCPVDAKDFRKMFFGFALLPHRGQAKWALEKAREELGRDKPDQEVVGGFLDRVFNLYLHMIIGKNEAPQSIHRGQVHRLGEYWSKGLQHVWHDRLVVER